MRKEKFVELLGEIDNKLIERADHATKDSQNKKSWKKWTVFATSFGMAAVLFITVLSYFNRPQYTAMDIANVFGEMKGSATSSYTEVYVASPEELELNPILTEKYIPIYQWQKGEKQSDFSKFVNEVISKFTSKINEEENPEIDFYDSDETVVIEGIGKYRIYSRQTSFYRYTTIQDGESWKGSKMSLGGIPVEIDYTQTDEEIISSLKAIKEKLFYILDAEFTDVKIVRSYSKYSENDVSGIYVYLYNEKDHFLNTIAERLVSDYICVSFHSNEDSDSTNNNILDNVSVSYYQTRADVNNAYPILYQMKRISLEQAEELLYKGYTFGNHVCPMCMKEQTAVDFVGYDFVGMTYLFEEETNISERSKADIIPFYVFYKRIGTAKNGYEIYAQTFVPAIEVSGYEEYFEMQEKLHVSQEGF